MIPIKPQEAEKLPEHLRWEIAKLADVVPREPDPEKLLAPIPSQEPEHVYNIRYEPGFARVRDLLLEIDWKLSRMRHCGIHAPYLNVREHIIVALRCMAEAKWAKAEEAIKTVAFDDIIDCPDTFPSGVEQLAEQIHISRTQPCPRDFYTEMLYFVRGPDERTQHLRTGPNGRYHHSFFRQVRDMAFGELEEDDNLRLRRNVFVERYEELDDLLQEAYRYGFGVGAAPEARRATIACRRPALLLCHAMQELRPYAPLIAQYGDEARARILLNPYSLTPDFTP